jgi:hypothetical protein
MEKPVSVIWWEIGLLKFVLTSLPVYALSFFRALSGIISSIESLLINFFWGGGKIVGK